MSTSLDNSFSSASFCLEGSLLKGKAGSEGLGCEMNAGSHSKRYQTRKGQKR